MCRVTFCFYFDGNRAEHENITGYLWVRIPSKMSAWQQWPLLWEQDSGKHALERNAMLIPSFVTQLSVVGFFHAGHILYDTCTTVL